MNIQRATEILEIELNDFVNKPLVKKQYHRLSLQHHPDKNNNSPESTELFKQINEAYQYLQSATDHPHYNKEQPLDFTTYADLLGLFIQSIASGGNNEPFINAVKSVLLGTCSHLTMQMFESCDKMVVVEVYEFICKYKHVLHVSTEILDQLKKVVVEKFQNDQLYILNPTLQDLFEGNVYKLMVDDKTYYVPLWNAETYFDNGNGGEIVVRCVPELPDNISIDENNDVCVHVSIKLTSELLERSHLEVPLYSNQTLSVCVSSLKLVKSQSITFRRQGIFRTNEYDSNYDQCKSTDVIVHFTLV